MEDTGLVADAREGGAMPPGLRDQGDLLFSSAWQGWGEGLSWRGLPGGSFLVSESHTGSALVEPSADPSRPHRILVWAEPGAHPDAVGDLVCLQAASFLLWSRGALCFHASSVVRRGEALVLLGASGAGKSTLAATFVEAGAGTLLGDELAILELRDGRAHALPGRPVVDLRQPLPANGRMPEGWGSPGPHPSGKTRVELDSAGVRYARRAAPLGGIYQLAPDRSGPPAGPPRLTRLSAREAFLRLVRGTATLIPPGEADLARHRDFLLALVAQLGVTEVAYSASVTGPAELRDALAADMERRSRGVADPAPASSSPSVSGDSPSR